jgi:subtilisin family serine protease
VLGALEQAIAKGARVLYLAFGAWGHHDLDPIFLRLREKGTLPIAPIGDKGPATSLSPGNNAHVLSVGAINRKVQVASFSSSDRQKSRGQRVVPALVATGQGVISCVPGGGYGLLTGSAVAAAHVPGLAALLLGAFPKAGVDQVETALLDSCSRPRETPASRANRGVPDAALALGNLKALLGA